MPLSSVQQPNWPLNLNLLKPFSSNGYPEDIVSTTIQNKSKEFALNSKLGPQKYPMYLKLS